MQEDEKIQKRIYTKRQNGYPSPMNEPSEANLSGRKYSE